MLSKVSSTLGLRASSMAASEIELSSPSPSSPASSGAASPSAAGLDALGDRDLALARQQLDRAHLAQVHAHRVVGAADILVVEIAGALLAVAFLLGRRGGRLLALLALDDVDAELGEHRHRVLD